MRMWMIDPKLMCDRHLLGEHAECHMFVGTINKGRSIDGYVSGGLVEVHSLHSRHDELAAEMQARGMDHKSPLPPLRLAGRHERLGEAGKSGRVCSSDSLLELMARCHGCRGRIKSAMDRLLQVAFLTTIGNTGQP